MSAGSAPSPGSAGTPLGGMDVVSACADALLAACAQAIALQNPDGGPVTIEEALSLAMVGLEDTIRRTMEEGARPR